MGSTIIDTSAYQVQASLSQEDKKSLLSIQSAMHKGGKTFSYLEIGSHLGGSLQTYLEDGLCTSIYSIDKRPGVSLDIRGLRNYSGVTTARMLKELSKYYQEECFQKLKCFEYDVSLIDRSEIKQPPTLCFIDGQHTDDAAFNDFLFCLSVASFPSVILFHDAHLIFQAILLALEHLRTKDIEYRAYSLPDYICVVEIGKIELFREEVVLQRIVMSQHAYLKHLKAMAYYREWYLQAKRYPLLFVLRVIQKVFHGCIASLRIAQKPERGVK